MNHDNEVKNVEKINFFPLYLALLGMFAVQIADPWLNSTLESLGVFMVAIAVGITLLELIAQRKQPANTVRFVCLVIFCIFSLFFSFQFNYSSIVVIITFLELPILIFYFNKNISGHLVNFIFILFFGLSLYYIYLYFSDIAYIFRGEYGITYLKELSLGYANPNQTAMFLMICFFVLLSGISYYKKKYIKLAFICSSLFLFFMIVKTGSRVCIILTLIFILYLFLKKKTIKWSVFLKISFFVPLLFFVFTLFFKDIYENFSILGESFETGRQSIYVDAFKEMDLKSFLFGDFGKFKFTNLHNLYLCLFCTMGLFGTIAFVSFLYASFKALTNKIEFEYQKVAFFGLILLIIHSSVEAALFTSGSAYAVSIFALYCICGANLNKEREGIHEDTAYKLFR